MTLRCTGESRSTEGRAGSAQCKGVLLAARMIDEREPESF